MASTDDETEPILSIGLLADIQYAPIPDGHSYSGQPRYYRHARDVARHAAQHFQDLALPLVVNLGDIVDGKCQNILEYGGSEADQAHGDVGQKAMDEIIEELSHYKAGPIIHAYGNHCLYNGDRSILQKKLKIPFVREPCGDLVGYSSRVIRGIRFVVLDSYDVAKMQRCQHTSRKYQEAHEILTQNNPNYPTNENSPEGLEDLQKRFVAFGGGVDRIQLEWLRKELLNARENNERVVILSHQPILPDSSNPVCLMWNYQDVLDILREYSDVVMVSLSGHAHKGGYKKDEASGIHFRVVEAVLESNYPLRTYAVLNIHQDKLEVKGFGECKSAVYDLEHLMAVTSNKTLS